MIRKYGSRTKVNNFSLRNYFCSQTKVDRWRSIVLSGETGVSVEESIDLVSMMNVEASKVFAKEAAVEEVHLHKKVSSNLDKYLKTGDSSDKFLGVFNETCRKDSLLLRCLSQVDLKRRIRSSVALFTSHKSLLKAWGPLVRECSLHLMQFEKVLKDFCQMNAIDQNTVKNIHCVSNSLLYYYICTGSRE